MFTLSHILSPMTTDQFVQDYWGQKAIYIAGSPDKFPDLFDWQLIDRIINCNRPTYEGLRLIYQNRMRPIEWFKSIDQWLSKGATLLITAIDQLDARIQSLAAMMSKDLNSTVNINCYVSCPAQQAFDVHFDKHDVYVVQVKGRKKWVVYDATSLKFPMDRQGRPESTPPTDVPYLEQVLDEGDVLYIPRGHWHYAVAETPSVHLSMGSQPRTGIDLLQWLTDELMDHDEFLRQDFPIIESAALGGWRQDGALAAHIEQFRHRVHQVLDGNLLEALMQYCMASNPVKRAYHFPTVWNLQQTLTPQTMWALHPAQKKVLAYDADRQLAIVETRGQRFRFQGMPIGMLDYLFSDQQPFCGQELLELNPGMTWEDLQTILVDLHTKGVLLLADIGVLTEG